MNTAFSHALRVLICRACGATVHVPVEGGTFRCEVCSESMTAPPRPEHGREVTSITEVERMNRLRAAKPTPLEVPEAQRELMEDGALRPDKAAAAMKAWQRLRAVGSVDPEDAPAFYHLTMLLCRRMREQRDHLQKRAVLETAIEATPSHRHQQMLRGVMACAAARADDLAAAEDWLAPCNMRSTDLHADSAYRFSSAYLATHKKQFSRVLDLLGTRHGDVPLAPEVAATCALLRANAQERAGHVDDAAYELSDAMERAGDAEVVRALTNMSELTLCPRSFAQARALRDKLAPARPTPRFGPYAAALPWTVLALAFLALAMLTDPGSTTARGQRLDVLFLAMSASFAVPVVIIVLRARGRPS